MTNIQYSNSTAAPDVCGASPAPNPQPPQGGCKNKNWKGDGYCDDENNNSGCEFDGGDCCGPAVKKNWCKACQCLDPKFGTTTTPKPKPCGNAKWKGNKIMFLDYIFLFSQNTVFMTRLIFKIVFRGQIL